MNTQETEVLSPEEINQRFVDAWVQIESYMEFVGNSGLVASTDRPGEEMAEFLQNHFTDDQIVKFNLVNSGVITYDEKLSIYRHTILCQEVMKNTDAIYADILNYGKMIYADLELFGYTKKSFLDLLLESGFDKEDVDDHKDYESDLADRELYSTEARIEPITNRRKLKKFLRMP